MKDTFGRWLAQFAESSTSLGDLARLAAADPAWPNEPDRLQTYVDYLKQAGAAPSGADGSLRLP
ncbi:YozE family protein [Streptomyces sp. NPDC051907]|uniref:YozE family protein n=1 Tax=Streptomyces sp. NPDC051907 TaxID=3155284 RepID=UPI00341D40F5